MNYDFLNTAVKSQQVLNYGNKSQDITHKRDAIHIAYGIDDNFVMPMGVSIISILENNKQVDIIFHVLTESLTEKNIEYLQKLVNDYKIIVFIHYIDVFIFEKLPSTEHFTKATYNRFLLPKILKNITRRVIYLDADILCYGSISKMVDTDFEDKIAVVVQDIGSVANRQIQKLSLENNQYFNAGFLYIDIEKWEQNNVSEKALEFSFKHLGKLNWLDQDALNVVLDGKTIFIEDKYDYIFDFGIKENKNINQLPEGVVFVHYAGRYKPWDKWCMHPLQKDFLKYLKISPWQAVPLKEPQNYKEMKKMAKSYLMYGYYFNSIIWFIKYTFYKLKFKINKGK